ncbi:hypothetical protein BWQ96_01964 [Gracilariopsis chorda]|uniref:TraB domain-containing protein n=1 Tax=Gracilariopsis chorda TaxID=448386 RepID=A0A2V3J1R3_9FLOR|nr:hypothetical protein BWQ96_01964 [Gracilariopsis chorda]|eukprot:PXF48275.1 hypothetical protein BWQ96_01964 [Gracilariopsis chorda]
MHIAEASANAARDLIIREHEKGSLGAVFLELDHGRFDRIKRAASAPDESLLSHALHILAQRRNPLAGLVELGMDSVYRSLHRLGFASGLEFRAAIDTAERLTVPIILGDQQLQITMQRLAEAFRDDFDVARIMTILMARSKVKSPESPVERKLGEAFHAIASGDVKQGQEKLGKLIDRDTVHQLIEPMRMFAPNIARAILYERDVIMTENLIKAAQELPKEKSVIVGVVGLAHVEGIVEEWDLQTETATTYR